MVMQKLNTGTTATITKGFLGIVLLSALAGLVLTDVGGFFTGGQVGGRDVAKVGSEEVSINDFGRVYQRRIGQSGMDDTLARQMGVPGMLLQQEIERRVLLQAAGKSGIRISNAYVASQLKQQLDKVQMAGTPNEKLQMVLMQQRMTEKELVELLRSDFSINLLGSSVATGDLNVPEQMVLAAFRADKQKRSAELVTVSTNALKNQAALSDKEIQDYFKENKEVYRTPESRDITALVLPQTLFMKDVTVTEAEAKEFYEQNKDKFLGPERVKLEQLIVADEAAARKIIDAKASSLAELKKDGQYLEQDWYGKNTLPKEFTDALYPNQPKGLVGPVKTTLGYHVVLVDSYEDAKPIDFAKARDTVERQLKDEKLDSQMTAFTNDIDNMIASDTPLDEVAAKYNLKTMTMAGLQQANAKAQIGKANLKDDMQQRILEAAFTLDADETSPLMDTPSGDYAMVQITKIVPSSVPEFKTIAARVKQDAAKARQAKDVTDLAESVMAKYEAGKPAAFDKAVRDAGLSVLNTAPVTKADAQKQHGQLVAETLFGLDPKDGIASFQDGDKVMLVRLKDIVSSTETPDQSAMNATQEALRTTMLQEIQQQFMQAWQKEIPVGVNTAVMQAMFSPQAKE